MNIFLAIQNRYHNVEIALYNGPKLLEKRSIDKKEASKLLIVTLGNLLEQQQLTITDLPFIVVNQGPAPFTTLRVVIASMNGISFASNIPLIGVDAFDAMRSEWHSDEYPTTIILFNAFAQEVYFAIDQKNKPIKKGYQRIDRFLEECTQIAGTIRFLGNGTELYREKIESMLGSRAFIPEPVPDYCSIESVAKIGHAEWNKGNRGSNQLLPLYLKQHPAQAASVAGEESTSSAEE